METLNQRIFKALLQFPNVGQEQIDQALAMQRQSGISLGEALIKNKVVNEKDLLVLLVKELHIPSIDLRKYRIDEKLKTVIPEAVARQYKIVPISQLGDTITVAFADPMNIFAIDDLKSITGRNIDVVMGTASQISDSISKFYGADEKSSVAHISKNIVVDDFEIVSNEETDTDVDEEAGEEAPIIRMVNLVIKEAIKQRASDIHMEPNGEELRIRYRIDGILQDILNIPRENQNAVTVRLKIMSRLDITATQVPQDGRFKMRIGQSEVDFRVSLLPTTFGQKIVMRVLDRKNLSVGLEKLGFSAPAVALLNDAIAKPFGMLLVTGPTGSGKSTTLYSILNKLNTFDRNIITVEDPVEYLVDGLTQIEVRPDIGLTFGAGLRSILRQSPDVVMVGEIRDADTADIAIKAALTGQLVLSTLHTNDAAGALTRLVDMGVESFLVASSLVLVCAQRLCRKICPHCKVEEAIPDAVLKRLGANFKPGTKVYRGKGCDHCRQTGYLGRIGITEILEVNDDVRELLLAGKSSDDIKVYAQEHMGMKTLWDDIIERVSAGDTTLEEVFRVASED